MAYARFTLTNLNDINIADVPAAFDFNGSIGTIDLGAPMAFVDEKYRIVLTASNNMDLDRTIALIIFTAQGEANRAVTQADIDVSMPVISLRIATYTLLSLIHNTGVVVGYRGSDTVSNTMFEVINARMHVSVLETARRIIGLVRRSNAALAEVGADSHLIPIALVANSKHREEESGHNWYTEDANTIGTTANRLLAMAGKKKREFTAFMNINGHDLWHFLPNETIKIVADALTGNNVIVIGRNMEYLGVNVYGKELSEIIDVGEACKDRYANAIIGASSLVLGIGYLKFFLTQVATKIPTLNISDVDKTADIVIRNLRDPNLTRIHLLNAKDQLNYTISFVVGFCQSFTEMEDDMRKHRSIVKFSENNVSAKSAGLSIGKSIKELTTSTEALSGAISELIKTMTAGLAGTIEATKVTAVPAPKRKGPILPSREPLPAPMITTERIKSEATATEKSPKADSGAGDTDKKEKEKEEVVEEVMPPLEPVVELEEADLSA